MEAPPRFNWPAALLGRRAARKARNGFGFLRGQAVLIHGRPAAFVKECTASAGQLLVTVRTDTPDAVLARKSQNALERQLESRYEFLGTRDSIPMTRAPRPL